MKSYSKYKIRKINWGVVDDAEQRGQEIFEQIIMKE